MYLPVDEFEKKLIWIPAMQQIAGRGGRGEHSSGPPLHSGEEHCQLYM